MNQSVIWALAATLGTWFVTALGAATVVFFRTPSVRLLNRLMGFASGVMIAASFWSLLQPAVERAEQNTQFPAAVTVTAGFLTGALFLWGSDKVVAYARRDCEAGNNRVFLLIASITLHNIPEGLAVGVAFGALQKGFTTDALAAAISVAVGIGLQNFPEGAAVSLPLRRDGLSRSRSFFYGQASGMVEPIAGVLGALLTSTVESVLPFALSFAAGAMILVAVHELIPECQRKQQNDPYGATVGIVSGFAVMMLLDVLLG